MSEYELKVRVVQTYTIKVEANSPEQAKEFFEGAYFDYMDDSLPDGGSYEIDKVIVPENIFTEEEVRNLNDFQDSGAGHPFTCENGCGNLIAKTDGWHCPKCDYRQYWAHKAMLDGSWRKWSLFG